MGLRHSRGAANRVRETGCHGTSIDCRKEGGDWQTLAGLEDVEEGVIKT